MSRIRASLRQALRASLAGLRERLDGGDASAPALRPEDVRLDAVQLVRQQGVTVDPVLVDLRGRGSVAAQGGVAGARRVTTDDVDRLLHELPDDMVVLVDDDGLVATDAALRLRRRGHPNAWAIQGGFPAYARAGGEVERP